MKQCCQNATHPALIAARAPAPLEREVLGLGLGRHTGALILVDVVLAGAEEHLRGTFCSLCCISARN